MFRQSSDWPYKYINCSGCCWQVNSAIQYSLFVHIVSPPSIHPSTDWFKVRQMNEWRVKKLLFQCLDGDRFELLLKWLFQCKYVYSWYYKDTTTTYWAHFMPRMTTKPAAGHFWNATTSLLAIFFEAGWLRARNKWRSTISSAQQPQIKIVPGSHHTNIIYTCIYIYAVQTLFLTVAFLLLLKRTLLAN